MLKIDIILVPNGAEHRAVCRGLQGIAEPPAVFATPVGVAIAPYLKQLEQAGCLCEEQTVLVMGLCGGLQPELATGAIALYQTCTPLPTFHSPLPTPHSLDQSLSTQIRQKLGNSIKLVNAVTSDRVISRSGEKRQLAQQFGADVIDMEGATVLGLLVNFTTSVAMLRVVSDDCHQNIPDLMHVFDLNGSLKPLPLMIAMLKQPIAAIHLIKGSIKGLKILQNLTSELFKC